MGEKGQAVKEGGETLGGPGAKEAEETHTGVRALGATGAATDCAGNDEGAHTTFGQIIIGRNRRLSDKRRPVRGRSVQRAHRESARGKRCGHRAHTRATGPARGPAAACAG